jgi:hypothetical protein
MILVAEAKYDGAVDRVDLAIIVQNDDGTSATATLESGLAEFIQGSETSFQMEFDRRHVMLNELDDGVSTQDVGQFYCFVLHPNYQHNLQARVTATLVDGSTATVTIPIEYVKARSRQPTSNPALSGREMGDYPLDPESP